MNDTNAYGRAVEAVAELDSAELLDLLRHMMNENGWVGTVFTQEDFETLVRENTPDEEDATDSEYIRGRACDLMDAMDYERAQELMTMTGWEYLHQAHDEVFGV